MVFGVDLDEPALGDLDPGGLGSPMPSVTGRRPIDTSTWSTSIFSAPFGVSNGTTTPLSVCSSVPTRASAWILVPRFGERLGQHVGDVAVRARSAARRRQRLQQRRLTPRSV